MQHASRPPTPVMVAIILALTSGAGCSTSPPRAEAARKSDEALCVTVQAALDGDPRIFARHIDVTVDNGDVTLGGFVWEDDERQFAKNDAAAVPGVRLVADEIELMRGGAKGIGR